MTLVTEVRLQSRKTHEAPKGKKSKKNKRRGLAEGEYEAPDACTDLYEAAQAQMQQEMKAAGLEGSLPMRFGGGSREKTSRKRKRQLEKEEPVKKEEEEQEHDEVEAEGGDEVTAGSGEGGQVAEEYIAKSETTIVDKMRVVYDSDGEIAERVVEQVETMSEEHDELKAEGGDAVADDQIAEEDTAKTETAIVDKVRVLYDSDGEVAERVIEQVEVMSEVKPEQQSIRDIQHKNSDTAAGKKKKKKTYPVPKDIVKFYVQRHVLFEKFEDGIQLDHESWYSVTPQLIAEHIAKRLSCDIVVDPFAGCGGNVIQLAMTCKHVIAIDIDPEKIRMAKHNAAIYGVADKIEWIVGNSIDILSNVKADAVFLSPPWGGVNYSRKCFSLEDMIVKGVSGLDLFAKAQQVSKNIAYYLPKGTPVSDLEALTPGEPVEREAIFLDKKLKVVTAYYGDLVASKKQREEAAPNEAADP